MNAILRNGDVLEIGDEVETNFHPTCKGQLFIICEMNKYQYCESGVLVVAHLKGYPERKITGLRVTSAEGDMPIGIDANWFKKIK